MVKGVLSEKITWNWDTDGKEPAFQREGGNSKKKYVSAKTLMVETSSMCSKNGKKASMAES